MTDFIQARHFTKANRDSLRLVVIHTMESSKKPGTARAVANWFAGESAPQASAHACVDSIEVVLCVRAEDVAWHAPGANRDGYGIEHAGRASQSEEEWEDAASISTLLLSARHAADICQRYGIPAVRLTVDEVKDGKTKGFCGHIDVTKAFGKSTHTDPGPHFPWEKYLAMVDEYLLPGEILDERDTEPPEGHPA